MHVWDEFSIVQISEKQTIYEVKKYIFEWKCGKYMRKKSTKCVKRPQFVKKKGQYLATCKCHSPKVSTRSLKIKVKRKLWPRMTVIIHIMWMIYVHCVLRECHASFSEHALGVSASVPIPVSPSFLASVLLYHRTLCLRREKTTLWCPTSALCRTLMSKLLHMDPLVWDTAWGTLCPITAFLLSAISFVTLVIHAYTVCLHAFKPVWQKRERGAQYPPSSKELLGRLV